MENKKRVVPTRITRSVEKNTKNDLSDNTENNLKMDYDTTNFTPI